MYNDGVRVENKITPTVPRLSHRWSASVCAVVATQVCELDIIFNFEKAYFILDEFLLGGEAQETSKKNVLKAIEQADLLQEVQTL